MMPNSLTERITRSLAYMLRHQPEEFDLELDDHGFAEMEDVVCALNERLGEPIREEDVHRALASGDRPRYEIQEGRIRALYGHSIPIDPGEPSEPPELLYIGVSARDAVRAGKHGLQSGRRTFLHLAMTVEDAEETGRRMGGDWALITVHARDAWEEGINFFDRKALFLAEFVPTDFLDVGAVQVGSAPVREHDERGHGPRGGRRETEEHGHRGGGGRRERAGGRSGHDRGRGGERREAPARAADGGGWRPRHEPEEPVRRPERVEDVPRPPRELRPPRVTQEQALSQPTAAQSPAALTPSTSFGLGIFEQTKARARPAPAPVEEVRPEPRPAPPPPAAEAASDSFGAGIL